MNANWKKLLAAGTFAAGLLASTLFARAVTIGDTVTWLTQNGYTVVEIEVSDDGRTFEVKAIFNGAPVELYVDAATGVVTFDDDDDDDAPGASDDAPGASDDPSDSASDDLSDSASDDPSDSASDPSDSASDDLSDSASDDLSDSASDPSDSASSSGSSSSSSGSSSSS